MKQLSLSDRDYTMNRLRFRFSSEKSFAVYLTYRKMYFFTMVCSCAGDNCEEFGRELERETMLPGQTVLPGQYLELDCRNLRDCRELRW